MQGVCNLVEVPHSQTAIALLKRMQAEQLEMTKHAHAPLRRIIETLNANGTGAGDMVRSFSVQISYLCFRDIYMLSPDPTQGVYHVRALKLNPRRIWTITGRATLFERPC